MRRLIAAAALLACPCTAAAEDFGAAQVETLDTVTRPARISAYGGAVAWSRFRRGRYRVMVRDPRGGTRALPGVLSKSLPLEFDLGPAPGGGIAIVYSRCRVRLRGCDLFMQRVGEWREQAIASTRRFAEVRPAIWGDFVAFLRIPEGGRRMGAAFIRIFVRRLSGGRSRRLPGGPMGNLPAPRGFGIEGLDIGPRGVVFTWVSRNTGSTHYRVLLDSLRGRQRLIDEAESQGDVSRMHSASLSGSIVSYLETTGQPGAEQFTLRDLDLRTRIRSATGLPCAVFAAAIDGRRAAFLHTRSDCPGVPPGPPRYRVLYGSQL